MARTRAEGPDKGRKEGEVLEDELTGLRVPGLDNAPFEAGGSELFQDLQLGEHEAIPPGILEEGLGTGGKNQGERQKGKWGAVMRPLVALISPGAALRFWAWSKRHEEQLEGLPYESQLAQYLDHATFQHAMADMAQPEELRQYEPRELHLEGIRPLIEAETRALRTEMEAKIRARLRQSIQSLVEAGAVPGEVLQAVEEAGI